MSKANWMDMVTIIGLDDKPELKKAVEEKVKDVACSLVGGGIDPPAEDENDG